jgi:hypothetical protein
MKGKFLKSGKSVRTAICATIALGVLGMSAARADYVPCETPFISGVPLESLAGGVTSSSINTTRVVWGSGMSVSALSVSGRGSVSVTLADITWPEALGSLDLLVTDLNGLWRRLEGAGDLLIDVNGPTQLFAAVFATSASPGMPGLYNLRANFSPTAPVPLPAAVWLLLSAIGGLAAFKRKH